MTDAKKYVIDTTNNRVRVEPVPGGIILKLKPKRGRAWMEFRMPDHTASMITKLMQWAIDDDDKTLSDPEPLRIEDQNDDCNCGTCRQLRICAKLGMAPTATEFPINHRGPIAQNRELTQGCPACDYYMSTDPRAIRKCEPCMWHPNDDHPTNWKAKA